MKTPEQIADEAMRDDRGDDVAPGEWWRGSCEEMRQIIIAAIELDRAQRPNASAVIDGMFAAWENYDGDVSGFYDAWADYLENGTPVPDWARA